MKKQTINFGVRVLADSLEKLRYITAYDCRSTSSMLRVLISDCVEEFEKEHGTIYPP